MVREWCEWLPTYQYEVNRAQPMYSGCSAILMKKPPALMQYTNTTIKTFITRSPSNIRHMSMVEIDAETHALMMVMPYMAGRMENGRPTSGHNSTKKTAGITICTGSSHKHWEMVVGLV